MYKYVNFEDEIWEQITRVLPEDNNNKTEEKLLLINAVLYLLHEKQAYHSQLHWLKLENDVIKNIYILNNSEDFTECNKVNINSLRRKFNRWRSCGIWEALLPIFDNFKKYSWITEIGRYEVFLICSNFACVKHKLKENKYVHNKEESETKLITQDKKICGLREYVEQQNNLLEQRDDKIYELNKTIRQQNDRISQQNDYINQQNDHINQLKQSIKKEKKRIRILKGEETSKEEPIKDNETENNAYTCKYSGSLEYEYNQMLKLKDRYIRRLLDYGYNPAYSKRENIEEINDFRDYLKRHPKNRHNKEIRSDDE